MEKCRLQENNNLLKNKRKKSKSGKPIWIIISFAILLIILLLPAPIMAKGALAILAFAVMWVTEADVSSISNNDFRFNHFNLGFSPVQQRQRN